MGKVTWLITWHGLAWAEVFFHHLVVLSSGHIVLFGQSFKYTHMLFIFQMKFVTWLRGIIILKTTVFRLWDFLIILLIIFFMLPPWILMGFGVFLYYWVFINILSDSSFIIAIIGRSIMKSIFTSSRFFRGARSVSGSCCCCASHLFLRVTIRSIEHQYPVYETILSDWKQIMLVIGTHIIHYRKQKNKTLRTLAHMHTNCRNTVQHDRTLLLIDFFSWIPFSNILRTSC